MHEHSSSYKRINYALGISMCVCAITSLSLGVHWHLSHENNTEKKPDITSKQTADTSNELIAFRRAIAIKDGNAANRILHNLETTKNFRALIEAAKIKLTEKDAILSKEDGLRIISNIFEVADDDLKQEAAKTAGLHFKNSPYPADKSLAIRWFNKAAELGHYQAHAHLGDLYSSDNVLEKDYQKALAHYEQAAEYGSVAPIMSFARKITRLAAQGEDCGIDPYTVAGKHLASLKAEAVRGKIAAAKELGRLYLQGRLIEKDEELASQWLNVAAKAGDAGALLDIAKMQLNQINQNAEPKDRSQAINLLEISGSKGNGAAFATLAKFYLNENTETADKMAFEMYKKSMGAGYFRGLEELRSVYEGELLLNRNPARVSSIKTMLDHLVKQQAGYAPLPGKPTENIELAGQAIDNLVVGSIEDNTVSNELKSYNTGMCTFTNTSATKPALEDIESYSAQ